MYSIYGDALMVHLICRYELITANMLTDITDEVYSTVHDSHFDARKQPEEVVDEDERWKAHVSERMTECGAKALVCQWVKAPENGTLCMYYNIKNAAVRRHVEVTHLGILKLLERVMSGEST
ncbi:hypothetical protein BDQ17DRAFT_1334072 [Cyathus striatus]|nr:hypothetical protein BDQ17DRAFT_1334072 [Cyathus striatus]